MLQNFLLYCCCSFIGSTCCSLQITSRGFVQVTVFTLLKICCCKFYSIKSRARTFRIPYCLDNLFLQNKVFWFTNIVNRILRKSYTFFYPSLRQKSPHTWYIHIYVNSCNICSFLTFKNINSCIFKSS